MSSGRLIPPDLDDRTWKDIVDEAKALIPKYTPEWTDHNPSDLGITLIELFAWIVEGMIYRLNRVPDKNLIEFLNLLGITRDPATPASALLTYRLVGGTPPTTVPKGSLASTQQTERDEGIVFETDQDVRLLPINLTTVLYIRKVFLSNKYQNITARISGSPLSGMTIDISSTQSVTVALGFDSASTDPISLLFRFSRPAKKNDIQITWLYSGGTALPTAWPSIPTVNDATDTFQKNGAVSLTVPASWASQNPQSWLAIPPDSMADQVNQPLFWIGIRINNLLSQPFQLGIEHALFNSVSATNALTIKQPELLGVSNGKPFQFFELRNRPLFKRQKAKDPYDHLIIQVREPLVGGGFGPWTVWTHRDDFPEGPGSYFRLDPVAGTISMGNYEATTSPAGHGNIPKSGGEIRALTYRYVEGGVKGNVPPGTINVIRTPIAGVTTVVNLGTATGGSNEEDIDETKRRGPEVLRNRYRAVTVEDYEYLAREATTDIKKIRCLPPRSFTSYDTLPPGVNIGDPWTYGGLNRDVGNSNVIIIPDAPLSNRTPKPSEELLQEVSDYLEERRTITTFLHVTSPRYLPIKVTVDIKVWKKAVDTGLIPDPATSNQFRDEVNAKIEKYLHPLLGGAEENGWEIGQDITISGLFEYIKPDPAVGFISNLAIQALTPLYQPIDRPFPLGVAPGVWVQLADYEIVCSATTHAISVVKI